MEEFQKSLALCDYNHPLRRLNSPTKSSESKTIRLACACTSDVHSHYVDQSDAESWAKLNTEIADKQVSPIGECGLNFNRNFLTKSNKLYVFNQQLNIAAEKNMVMYSRERDALFDQISLLKMYSKSLKFTVIMVFV